MQTLKEVPSHVAIFASAEQLKDLNGRFLNAGTSIPILVPHSSPIHLPSAQSHTSDIGEDVSSVDEDQIVRSLNPHTGKMEQGKWAAYCEVAIPCLFNIHLALSRSGLGFGAWDEKTIFPFKLP
jgi:hypothetical protein